MDTQTQSELGELRKLIADLARMVAASLPKPKAKPKPRPAAAPASVATELERVLRDFEFLREHGGVIAEGRLDRATGDIHWRR
jgi:hypothetical protein